MLGQEQNKMKTHESSQLPGPLPLTVSFPRMLTFGSGERVFVALSTM